jgi:hypothetical protein
VHVATGIEQGLHRLEVSVRGGEMQRGGIVAAVARIRIGSVLEQQAHGICVLDGRVESGAALAVALTHELWLLLEQGAERRDISRPARRGERVERRVFRELWVCHRHLPSIHARPVSASLGLEVRVCDGRMLVGGFNPSRGP